MSGHRVSRGDAKTVFEEFAGAGKLIRSKANVNVELGTPADLNFRASIRPYSDPTFNGRHYCAEDWHVILVTYFSGNSGNSSFTHQDAENELDPLVITITLDGEVLVTERTSVKRCPTTVFFPPEYEITEAYFIQEGRLMAPDELSVGTHSLSYTAVGLDVNDADSMTFVIDPPGAGACA
jgi:hypothetical protein